MGTFFLAFTQADFFGKLIFLGLFSLSIICWFFLIHKIWMLRKVKAGSKQFQLLIEKEKNSLLNLSIEMIKGKGGLYPFHHLYLTLKEKTIEILDKNHFFSLQKEIEEVNYKNYLSHSDIECIESHLESSIIKQRELIEKNMFILSTIVTLAPFLGLLGTVWGILITFGELQSGHSISSNTIILGGLSTALVTTVLGLLIAIPALIGYNYLKNSSRHYTTEMCDFGHFLLTTVELYYRKVDVS